MRIWKLTTTVHTNDEYTAFDVLNQIQRDCNRGDGIHLNVLNGNRPILKTIKHVRKVKDE